MYFRNKELYTHVSHLYLDWDCSRDDCHSHVVANVHRLNERSNEAANVVEHGLHRVGRGHHEHQVHHAGIAIGRRIWTNLWQNMQQIINCIKLDDKTRPKPGLWTRKVQRHSCRSYLTQTSEPHNRGICPHFSHWRQFPILASAY